MQKKEINYSNAGYWFLVYIPLAIAGFLVTYFTVLSSHMPWLFHVHFVLMTIWIGMVVVQPVLIKRKKLRVHLAIGKFSYFLMPVLILVAWELLHSRYILYMDTLKAEQPLLSQQEVFHKGAIYVLIAFVYIIWLALFYLLAIVNKRRTPVHARYMIAAALTLTGPTVDRIFFALLEINTILGFPAEGVSFLLIDLCLLLLIFFDYRAGKSIRTLLICLGIYIIGQVFYFLADESPLWDSGATLIFNY